MLGKHLPSTLGVVEHALWRALDPDVVIDAVTADALLARLDVTVTRDFEVQIDGAFGGRHWMLLERVRTHFPRLNELAMDYVACYVILFRLGRKGGNPAMWTCALDNLAKSLSAAPLAPALACLGGDLEAFIGDNVVPADVGPRRQEPGWPLYRGDPVQ